MPAIVPTPGRSTAGPLAKRAEFVQQLDPRPAMLDWRLKYWRLKYWRLKYWHLKYGHLKYGRLK